MNRQVLFKKIFLGALLTGVSMNPVLQAQTNYHLLKAFGFLESSSGQAPASPLLQARDGMLYGTAFPAYQDSYSSPGVVFRLSTNGSGFEVLHRFSESGEFGPQPGLVQGTDGALYGTTIYGGTGAGTVFRLNTDGSDYSVLHRFDAGAEGGSPRAGLGQGRDGTLYGTTSYGGSRFESTVGIIGAGTVFKLKEDGSEFAVLHRFGGTQDDGERPLARLLQCTSGVLCGTTYSGGSNGLGTVFKLNTDGTGYTVLHDFTTLNGANPQSGLVQGEDGTFYGSTTAGGSNNVGTLFKLNESGGGFKTLHHFTGFPDDGARSQATLILARDTGELYGTTVEGGIGFSGVVFKLKTDGDAYSVLHTFSLEDGEPSGGLAQGTDGALYGTTSRGGTSFDGNVFKLNTGGNGYRTLFNFNISGGDGEHPNGGLVRANDGTLYGTTSSGGSNDGGTVFKLNGDGNGYRLLHSFVGSDGADPNTLILASDGTLYGTTSAGGAAGGRGTVFSLKTDGSGFRVLHSFPTGVGDGDWPRSSLALASDGTIFGSTFYGGDKDYGTIFQINRDGGGYRILRSFSVIDGDGGGPLSLIEGRDAALYGTTAAERLPSAIYFGTVFRLSKAGDDYRVLHWFDGFTLWNSASASALAQGSDGNLYGTTSGGYPFLNDNGAVFSINTNGSGFRVVHPFVGSDDGFPNSLVVSSDGMLFGTTLGTAFRVKTDGTGFSVLANLEFPSGLALDSDGALIGTTAVGGALNLGTVYRLSPAVAVTAIRLEAGGVRLSFAGAPAGQLWQVQANISLSTNGWQVIGSATADIDGNFEYFDPSPPNHSTRFYRCSRP